MKKLIIFGAGDIAQLAHFYFEDEGKYQIVAFCVDDSYRSQNTFCELPLVGLSQLKTAYPPDKFDAFVALSYADMNHLRERKCAELKALGYYLVSYISPHCTCLTKEIGENCFILEDNTIQPFVKIGNNVTLWSGNHIGHHSIVGDNCFITSHVVVSGGVKIEKNCFIGVNATLRDHITLGEATLVGAGALIVKSTPPKEVYRGTKSDPMSISSNEIKKL